MHTNISASPAMLKPCWRICFNFYARILNANEIEPTGYVGRNCCGDNDDVDGEDDARNEYVVVSCVVFYVAFLTPEANNSSEALLKVPITSLMPWPPVIRTERLAAECSQAVWSVSEFGLPSLWQHQICLHPS